MLKNVKELYVVIFLLLTLLDILKIQNQNNFTLAANAYVPYSFDHPLEVNESNVIGTLNILEAQDR